MVYWNAKPGCPEQYIGAPERAFNAMPLEWRSPPQTGEIFPTILERERRLRGFASVEGFDIVRNDGGNARVAGCRFDYTFMAS
jgi:hypothetical protein